MCFLLFSLSITGCGTLNKKVEAAQHVDTRLVKANTDFAFRLFAELRGQEDDKNIFFSMASIAFASGMVYNGAAGETQKEMARAMGIDKLTFS